MPSRRVLSVYADDTRVDRQDVAGTTTIRDLKGQVKDGLKVKLGLTNNSFHPSEGHNDILFSVPSHSSKKITDNDTVAGLCPTSSDYIMAVVPSATTVARHGNHFPEVSLLFPIQPYSTSMPAHATPSPVAPQANEIDYIFNMLTALGLKLETTELKLETAELLRKKETERLELTESKLETAELLRKKDTEKLEVLRKETERLEVLRKRETQRLEALRQKDIKDLEIKIEYLKQNAIEQEDQWKQKHESTQRYIECLASDIDATTDFLAVGDEAGLDRIKRRNLLDRAQASLALSLGLSHESYFASIQFRETLNQSSSLEERQQRLLEMLTKKKDDLPSQAALLITKPEALNLLAERFPRVRLDGDQVAHGYRERSWYEGAVSRSVGKDKIALTSLLDYVSPAAR